MVACGGNPSISEGSIGSRYIFTRPQKWLKTHILGLLTTFLSKTRANSLFPFLDSDSTGKNLPKSVTIGQVPKKSSKMPDSDIVSYVEYPRVTEIY